MEHEHGLNPPEAQHYSPEDIELSDSAEWCSTCQGKLSPNVIAALDELQAGMYWTALTFTDKAKSLVDDDI